MKPAWTTFAALAMTAGAAMQLLATSTLDVRTASYNIRLDTTESDAQNNWSSRKSDLVALVKKIAPEVIGFQEVKPSQYNYLKGQLSGYEFYGRYRDNGSNSEACPVAYLKSRFDFLDGGTFWLSSTPEVVGSKTWGNGIEASGYPRICTWALLKDKPSGGFVCFACTHLDLKAGPRLAGMNLILSSGRLGRIMEKGIPVVLVGDMNEYEDSPAMAAAAAVNAATGPNAKIIGTTLPPVPNNQNATRKVLEFNKFLTTEYANAGHGELPDNFHLLDFVAILQNLVQSGKVPRDLKGYCARDSHPNWRGHDLITRAFAEKISEVHEK